jgi:calcineurin-like phosphoesterase family protein
MHLVINENRKVWITSDTHYGHTNICRGITNWRLPDGSIPINQTRDFKTLDEMNNTIVNNINNRVGQDDVLVHLGDWSFGGFDNIQKFRDRIFCNEIHLVLGNHDHHIERNRGNVKSLFTSVQHFLRIEYGKTTIETLHYPISSWNNLRKGRIHLHGHCHFNNDNKFGNGRRMDVGVDGNVNFEPYDLLFEVIRPMMKREIGSELGNLDHHVDDMKGVVG